MESACCKVGLLAQMNLIYFGYLEAQAGHCHNYQHVSLISNERPAHYKQQQQQDDRDDQLVCHVDTLNK